MNPVEHLRNQAKRLLKAVKNNELMAVARVEAVLRDGIEDFGLMKSQHVIAVEHVFRKWEDMLHSGDEAIQAAIARKKS